MIYKVLELADLLPSGAIDSMSMAKLIAETHELNDAGDNGDFTDEALELADVVYYAVKVIATSANQVGLTIDDAFAACAAKYELRARSGNPKNHQEERRAVARVLGGYDEG